MPIRRCSGVSTRNSPPSDQNAWPPRLCSGSWSSRSTFLPASASSAVATRPARPAPTTMTSASMPVILTRAPWQGGTVTEAAARRPSPGGPRTRLCASPPTRSPPRRRCCGRSVRRAVPGPARACSSLAAVFDWFDVPLWVWPLYAVLAIAYVVAMPRVRYRVHRWESTETAVYTQTGWLSRERRIAPMSRVQTVDFEQSAIGRLLGLASVTVTTASAAGPLRISDDRQAGGRPAGRRPDPAYRGRGRGRHVSEPPPDAEPSPADPSPAASRPAARPPRPACPPGRGAVPVAAARPADAAGAPGPRAGQVPAVPGRHLRPRQQRRRRLLAAASASRIPVALGMIRFLTTRSGSPPRRSSCSAACSAARC